MRACILGIIPGDIAEKAVEQCRKTLQKGISSKPLEDQIRTTLKAFDGLGISKEMIEERLGHKTSAITAEELVDLNSIGKSIKDNMTSREEWFNFGVESKKQADDLTQKIKGKEEPAPPKMDSPGGPVEKAEEPLPDVGFQCPHCNFRSVSERGLKKHVTQSHKGQGESASDEPGTPISIDPDPVEVKITEIMDSLERNERGAITSWSFGALCRDLAKQVPDYVKVLGYEDSSDVPESEMEEIAKKLIRASME